MKIEIEVSDFYLDEEDLETGLKDYIIRESVRQISDSIKQKVEQQITNSISSRIAEIVNQEMEETIKTQTFTMRGTKTTFKEYIQNSIDNNRGWSNPVQSIEDITKKYVEQLRKNYDMLFASQIVLKMNQNNMLKEGIADILIEKGANND